MRRFFFLLSVLVSSAGVSAYAKNLPARYEHYNPAVTYVQATSSDGKYCGLLNPNTGLWAYGKGSFVQPTQQRLSGPSKIPYAQYKDAYLACFKELGTQVLSQMFTVSGVTTCNANNSDWNSLYGSKEWRTDILGYQPKYYTVARCKFALNSSPFGTAEFSTYEGKDSRHQLNIFIEAKNLHLYASEIPQVRYDYKPETTVGWDRFGEPDAYSPAFVSNFHLDIDGFRDSYVTDTSQIEKQIINEENGMRTDYKANFQSFVTCLQKRGIAP